MEKNYQVVFTEKNKVELLEVPMPELKSGELLVKSLVSQISIGTELTLLEMNVDEDSTWVKGISGEDCDCGATVEYPCYPGYSNVGEIIDVGEGVDRCLIGKRIMTMIPHVKYATINVNDHIAFVADGVDSDAAVFGTIATITMGSVRGAQIRAGETVVIFGAGLIGQILARQAQIVGAYNVIVADLSDERLALLPKDSSFIPVNTAKEDIRKVIRKYNNGKLADVVFETTSAPSLAQYEMECLAMCGRLVITSSPKGKSSIDFDYCNRLGITIIGAHNFMMHPPVATPQNPWTQLNDAIYFQKLLARDKINVDGMVTHRASYKQAVDMYKMLVADRTKALAVHLYWGEE
jgi:2-desacetyl-2-hydroxyethyl bacteriochlorophyllide A dehydrogenase